MFANANRAEAEKELAKVDGRKYGVPCFTALGNNVFAERMPSVRIFTALW
jgi:hypothetical protein